LSEAASARTVRPALEEATTAGIVEEIPGPGLAYAFTHELVRRALSDDIERLRRSELHRLVGEALERVHAGNLDRVLGELAYHFTQAAPLEGTTRAVTYNLRAAVAALNATAFEDAVARFETALELGISSPRERASVELELARTLWLVGRHGRSDVVLDDALADALASEEKRIEWYVRLEQSVRRRGAEPSELEAATREAIEVFEQLGDELGLARARRMLAVASSRRGKYEQARVEAERALAHADAASDPQEHARAIDALCTALLYGPTPAPPAIERCRALLRAAGDRLTEANILTSLCGLEAMTGATDDARESARRARAIYEELDLPIFVAALAGSSAPVELAAGDPVAAEFDLRHALDVLAEGSYGDAVAYRSALLAVALLAQGRREEAAAVLEGAVPKQLMTRIVHAIASARVNGDVEAARTAVELAAGTEAVSIEADAHAALADLLEDGAHERRLALELYEAKGNLLAVRALTRVIAAL
jgi:tetratricopeptide (TPR) repeat protein